MQGVSKDIEESLFRFPFRVTSSVQEALNRCVFFPGKSDFSMSSLLDLEREILRTVPPGDPQVARGPGLARGRCLASQRRELFGSGERRGEGPQLEDVLAALWGGTGKSETTAVDMLCFGGFIWT